MKRKLALILALTLLFALWIPSTFAEESAPATTITTVAEFEAMTDGNYVLGADLDFSGKTYTAYIVQNFSGTLDGNGHSLTGVSIVTTGEAEKVNGIFQTVSANADTKIVNLTVGSEASPVTMNLENTQTATGHSYGVLAGAQSAAFALEIKNVTVYANISVTSSCLYKRGGGFIGSANQVTLENCEMHGEVLTKSVSSAKKASVYAGGFIGNTEKHSSFKNCKNYAKVVSDITNNATNNTRSWSGGFVGICNMNGVDFDKCINYGEVSYVDYGTESNYRFIRHGGLVGCMVNGGTDEGMTINHCINFGFIQAGEISTCLESIGMSTNDAGGMVGNVEAGTCLIENCINLGRIVAFSNRSALCGCGTISKQNNKYKNGALVFENKTEAVKPIGVQYSAVKDDVFDIRLVASVDSLQYQSVGFSVLAFYKTESEMVLAEPENAVSKTVYTEILSDGNTVTASSFGANYLTAVTIRNIPSIANDGTVILVITPYVVSGETVSYGASFQCIFENGVPTLCELVTK